MDRQQTFQAIATRACSPSIDVVPHADRQAFLRILMRLDLRHGLDLEAMLAAEAAPFTIEVARLYSYWDSETGELLDGITPSFTKE